MAKFNIILYLIFFIIFCYSSYLWINDLFRKKSIKKLKKRYPNGFIYKNDVYLSATSKKEKIPLLKKDDVSLFESIGVSNFVDDYYTKIDVTDHEYTCYIG